MKVYSHHILKLRVVALMAALTCLFSAFSAQAALTTYLALTMDGSLIPSDITSSAHTNTISCSSWESEIYRPGAPENPAVHRPIKFVKPVDRGTPKIGEALRRNQTGTAIFRFYQPSIQGGTEVQFFTVTLQGVRVKSQRILMANNLNPDTMRYEPSEEVTLSYTSITIHHEASGNDTTLDVESP